MQSSGLNIADKCSFFLDSMCVRLNSNFGVNFISLLYLRSYMHRLKYFNWVSAALRTYLNHSIHLFKCVSFCFMLGYAQRGLMTKPFLNSEVNCSIFEWPTMKSYCRQCDTIWSACDCQIRCSVPYFANCGCTNHLIVLYSKTERINIRRMDFYESIATIV